MTSLNYGLPCAWHYEPARDITLRWGRPDGYFTVHDGNQRGKRDDHTLLDTVRVSKAWQEARDVARKAHEWARNNPRPNQAGGHS